jgi:predicted MFS family arabinose efflux permease
MPDDQTTARLRRNSAFKWLLAGSTFSMLGSRLTTIAYPLLILAWHGSPVVAGLAVCAANAPSVLVYIPAGALVDRSPDPRRTLIAAEILRGGAIAVIICVLALNWECIPLVILVAIFEESFEVFALLAERRYVRALVKPDQASAAQVGMEARSHVVVLAGRALGGLLFGWAQCLPFIADLLSFWISVLSVAGVSHGEKEAASSARAVWPNLWSLRDLWAGRPNLRDLWEEVRAGWSELFEDSFAFYASLSSAGMTLVSQALIIVFLASAHNKHVSSVVIGSVLATSGFGGLFGAVVSRRNRRPWNKSPLKFQPLIWTGMLLFLAVSGWPMVWVMAIVMAVLGLVGAMGNVELDIHLFVKVPKEKLARVTSIEMLLDFLASVLGPALGGLLIESGGTEISIWVLLAASAMIAVLALWLKVPSIASATATPKRRSERVAEPPVRVHPVRGNLRGSSDGQRGMWQRVAQRAVHGEAMSALRPTPPSGFPRTAATHPVTVARPRRRQPGSRVR